MLIPSAQTADESVSFWDSFSAALQYVAWEVVWGLPLVILLMGGGFLLAAYSGFLPLTGFKRALLLILGRYHHEADKNAEGQISHFQALSNALAATIGLGNIAGVAVALSQGGPGAIFWMWVAALIGMNTKFFECTLAVMFRGKDYRGQVQGGPMYVLQSQLGAVGKWLAAAFAVFGLIGTMALFQINQLSSYVNEYYPLTSEPILFAGAELNTTSLVVGLICAALVAVVLAGGIRRIAHWTSAMTPTMCLLYIVSGLVILVLHLDRIPQAFASILTQAWTGKAAIGAAEGVGVIAVLRIGVTRAAFSNEAGVGTAPMAHSNAKTSEPISEGLVAMVGPMLDTLIVCTFTALIILVTHSPQEIAQIGEDQTRAIVLTSESFERALPGFGRHFLGSVVVLFAFSTMLGMANYNEKCWSYLFRGRWRLGGKTFIVFFCATIMFGALAAQDNVVAVLDLGYGLMAIPNMIATLWLARRVKQALRQYRRQYG